MSKGYVLPKTTRLAKKKEIKDLFDQGVRLKIDNFGFCVKFTQNNQSRLLVSVSKRVGSSPQRNYLKRIVREAFRVQRGSYAFSFDIAVFFSTKCHGKFTLAKANLAMKKVLLHMNQVYMK